MMSRRIVWGETRSPPLEEMRAPVEQWGRVAHEHKTTRAMRPNETADIRRALDRLQQTFEVLSDRYRDLRRERKQLRERIEEMQRGREMGQAAHAAQLERVPT